MPIPTLTYIGSGTASGGTVDFINLSSTYKGYRFYLSAIALSASDILIIRASSNNGSTYDNSAIYQMVGSSSGTAFGTSTQTGFPAQSENTAQTGSRTGFVDIYFNNIANSILTFKSFIVGTVNNTWDSGAYLSQATINAIRFTVVGANNLSSGTIYQYGIT